MNDELKPIVEKLISLTLLMADEVGNMLDNRTSQAWPEQRPALDVHGTKLREAVLQLCTVAGIEPHKTDH
jgi:hypothetical protein